MRAKSLGSWLISSWKAANLGDHSVSMACTCLLSKVLVKMCHSVVTRLKARPASSISARVLSKVGGDGLSAMRRMSARYWSIPDWNAAGKAATCMRPNGGMPP